MKRINITIDEQTLKKLDKIAKRNKRNRSEQIREFIKRELLK